MKQPASDGAVPPEGPALPLASEEQVSRPSVEELLDRGGSCRICVVIGAAGWGKTTAVASWCRHRPTVWLRYEDHEGDPGRLRACLHRALGVGQAESATAVGDWLPRVLSNDLILVLDDLHGLAPDSDAAHIVDNLCQRVPDRLHLVLISRRELPFSLQRLWGRGLVTEIHAPDLAFDVADIETLLRKTAGNDPPGLARRVWEHTGGWATAVQCAIRMLRAVRAEQRLVVAERLSHPGERFHDYLAEEVIGTAPGWVQQLLRSLAIFGEVRSAVEIAPGFDDPTTALAELIRQGLVRRNVGDNARWSLIRPLRDYFEHGTALSSAERTKLHITAAQDCIAREAPTDALRHLLAAEDHAACATLLLQHGDVMLRRGEVDVVLEAATRLPPEYVDDPQIQQTFGLAQQVRGHWAQALTHFQLAGHDRDQLDPALAWRVGTIAFTRGEFTEVQSVIRRTRLDHEDTLDGTQVLALAATIHRMTGDLESMRKAALQARAAARQCDHPRAWACAHHVLMMLAASEGDWRQADTHYTGALRNAEAIEDLLLLAWIKATRAFHLYEAGAPQRSLTEAQLAVNLAERCESPFLIAHALTTRARAQARLGKPAEGDFATAVDLFQCLGSRFVAWPLCGLGDLHRTRGHLVRAQALYEEALALAEPHHDVFGLSSALTGLARVAAVDDPPRARELAARAVNLAEGLRNVPALLTRGWVELMNGDQHSAFADSHRAITLARQRRDNLGLAEAITLSTLAASNPPADAAMLREAIDIWQETGCRLEEAATRIVAAHISAPIPQLDVHHADQVLQDHGVDVDSRRVAGPLGVLARSTPGWSIKTLGMFQVLRGGVPIPNIAWKSRKARDLLRILVARRRPTHRDQLMELLWPEVEPSVASNRLSVLLSTVRDVLQPHPASETPLITTDGVVSLNPAQVSIDVEDFLSQAATALDANRANDPTATAQLTAALAVHTGEFFEDDPYQDWASWLTEEVRATHIALLRAMTARMCETTDTDAAVRYTLRLLEQDNYDEQAHLTLVGILYNAGRIGEARRHYQTYRRRMTEIGIRPRPLQPDTAPPDTQPGKRPRP